MKFHTRRLRHIASIQASNVDKKSAEGDVPVRLCNYVDVYRNDLITRDLPFMSATATSAQSFVFELRAGDVVLTKDSERPDDIGVPAYVPKDLPGVVCGYHLSILRTDESILYPKYLFWFLNSKPAHDHFTVSAQGITRFALGYGELGNTPVPVPSLRQQRAIVRFLDEETAKIDDLIKKKQQLASLLREEWSNKTQATLFGREQHAALDDSGVEWLGRLPRHWRVLRTAVLFRERDERGEADLPQLEVSINRGVFRREFATDRIERVASDLANQKIGRSGDLVFNKMRMWQGAVGVAPEDGLVSTDYTVAIPGADALSGYVQVVLKTHRARTEIDKWSHGMVRDRNSTGKVSRASACRYHPWKNRGKSCVASMLKPSGLTVCVQRSNGLWNA